MMKLKVFGPSSSGSKHKGLKLFGGIIVLGSFMMFGLLIYSYISDDDAYMMLYNNQVNQQEEKTTVNVGKVIYKVDKYVPPKDGPLSEGFINGGEFTANEKDVLNALNQLLGVSYTRDYVKNMVGNKAAANQVDWLYKWFPLTIALYCKDKILPATQLFQSGLESGWGTNSNALCWKKDNNPTGMSIMKADSKVWSCPGIGTVSCGTTRGVGGSEGGYYQHFNSPEDGFTASAYHQSHDKLYKKMVDLDSTEQQLTVLKDSGWVAKGKDGYDQIINTYNALNGQKFNEIGKKVRDALAKQYDADGNRPVGSEFVDNGKLDGSWKPGQRKEQWKPAGSKTLAAYYKLNMDGVSAKAAQAINIGGSLMGSPYFWGFMGYPIDKNWRSHAVDGGNYSASLDYMKRNNMPLDGTWKGFDCSGFIAYVYNKACNAGLGEGTSTQLSSGKLQTINASEVRPGDLVYYGGGGAHHVGIFMYWKAPGWPAVLQAPSSGKGVNIGCQNQGELLRYRRVTAAYS